MILWVRNSGKVQLDRSSLLDKHQLLHSHILRFGVCLLTLSPTQYVILQSLSVWWSQDSHTSLMTTTPNRQEVEGARLIMGYA